MFRENLTGLHAVGADLAEVGSPVRFLGGVAFLLYRLQFLLSGVGFAKGIFQRLLLRAEPQQRVLGLELSDASECGLLLGLDLSDASERGLLLALELGNAS